MIRPSATICAVRRCTYCGSPVSDLAVPVLWLLKELPPRKCIIYSFVLRFLSPSVPLTQSTDQSFDAGDIILLRKNKCNDHLPCILPEDTDPSAELCCGPQIIIVCVNPCNIIRIGHRKIKVFFPEIVIFFLRTVQYRLSMHICLAASVRLARQVLLPIPIFRYLLPARSSYVSSETASRRKHCPDSQICGMEKQLFSIVTMLCTTFYHALNPA